MARKKSELKQLVGRTTGRGARAIRCRSCGQEVLLGLDADVLAVQTTADWTPLDTSGELLALLQGRKTYRVDRMLGGNLRLTKRRAKHIARGIRTWDKFDIVPEHRCGLKPLASTSSRIVKSDGATVIDRSAPVPF